MGEESVQGEVSWCVNVAGESVVSEENCAMHEGEENCVIHEDAENCVMRGGEENCVMHEGAGGGGSLLLWGW